MEAGTGIGKRRKYIKESARSKGIKRQRCKKERVLCLPRSGGYTCGDKGEKNMTGYKRPPKGCKCAPLQQRRTYKNDITNPPRPRILFR